MNRSIGLGIGLLAVIASVFVVTAVVADASDSPDTDTVHESARAMARGGLVNGDDMPPFIAAVGAHGCILVDANGEPVRVSMGGPSSSASQPVGTQVRSATNPDEIIVETHRPEGIEDCSLDRDTVARSFFEGYPIADALEREMALAVQDGLISQTD